ncbi:beta-propeller domain-containing protein [Myxococcota bacterium]|nr:beta-propeller domain-containing protein [Myxococcota bacterium]
MTKLYSLFCASLIFIAGCNSDPSATPLDDAALLDSGLITDLGVEDASPQDTGAPDAAPDAAPDPLKLKPIGGCDEVVAEYKRRAKLRMRAAVHYERWRHCNSDPELMDGGAGTGGGPAVAAPEAQEQPAPEFASDEAAEASRTFDDANGEPEPPHHSNTTAQEWLVSESDFVKTDGDLIYILSENALKIVRFWEENSFYTTPNPELIAWLDLDGDESPQGLFLDQENQQLIVYTNLIPRGFDDMGLDPNLHDETPLLECEFGVQCKFEPSHQSLRVRKIDVSVPEQIEVIDSFKFNGGFMKAYQVNEVIYSVVGFKQKEIDGLVYHLGDSCLSDQEVNDLIKANEEKIDRFNDIDSILPTVNIESEDGQFVGRDSVPVTVCDQILTMEGESRAWFVYVLAQKMGERGFESSTTILSRPGAVYASRDRIYIAVPYSKTPLLKHWFNSIDEEEATVIHQIDLKSADGSRLIADKTPICKYKMSGVIPGRIIDAFNLSEWDGVLRVVTNHGYTPVHPGLMILADEDQGVGDPRLQPDMGAPIDQEDSGVIDSPSDPTITWFQMTAIKPKLGYLKADAQSRIESSADETVSVVRHTLNRSYLYVNDSPADDPSVNNGKLHVFDFNQSRGFQPISQLTINTKKPKIIHPVNFDSALIIGEHLDAPSFYNIWTDGEIDNVIIPDGLVNTLTFEKLSFNQNDEVTSESMLSVSGGSSNAVSDYHALTFYNHIDASQPTSDSGAPRYDETLIALPMGRCLDNLSTDEPNGAFFVWSLPHDGDPFSGRYGWAPHPEADYCGSKETAPLARAIFIGDLIITLSESRMRARSIYDLSPHYRRDEGEDLQQDLSRPDR